MITPVPTQGQFFLRIRSWRGSMHTARVIKTTNAEVSRQNARKREETGPAARISLTKIPDDAQQAAANRTAMIPEIVA